MLRLKHSIFPLDNSYRISVVYKIHKWETKRTRININWAIHPQKTKAYYSLVHMKYSPGKTTTQGTIQAGQN